MFQQVCFSSYCFRDRMGPKETNDRNFNHKDRFYPSKFFPVLFKQILSSDGFCWTIIILSKTHTNGALQCRLYVVVAFSARFSSFLMIQTDPRLQMEGTSFISLETTFLEIWFRIQVFFWLFQYFCFRLLAINTCSLYIHSLYKPTCIFLYIKFTNNKNRKQFFFFFATKHVDHNYYLSPAQCLNSDMWGIWSSSVTSE